MEAPAPASSCNEDVKHMKDPLREERCSGGSQRGTEYYKSSHMLILSSADLPPSGTFVNLQLFIITPTGCLASFPCPLISTVNPLLLYVSLGQFQMGVPSSGKNKAFQEPQYIHLWACSPTLPPSLVDVPQPKLLV